MKTNHSALRILSSLFCTPLSVLALSACGSGAGSALAPGLVAKITEPVGCPANVAQDQFWNALYEQAGDHSDLPSPQAMQASFEGFKLTKSSSLASAPAALSEAYSSLYASVYANTLADDNGTSLEALDPEARRQALIKAIAEMELGDRTTPEKSARQDAIEARFSRVARLSAQPSVAAVDASVCQTPTVPNTDGDRVAASEDPVPLFESYRKRFPASLYGAYKIMALGYQSCNVLDTPILTAKSASVAGITNHGARSNERNQGVLRTIESAEDAAKIMKTNPYYSARVTPSGSCLPQQKNPIIYDYGGKPAVNAKDPLEANLFANGGTGSDALGIDCSGYVSSALLVSGLRLKKNVSSKVAQTHGVSATMMMSPEANGLSCLGSRNTIKSNETLLPGDIIAMKGHVVMVDSVGADPFGISAITKTADCTAAKLPSSRFDFTITQSSPSKGGIGLNRFRAADYLAGNATMGNGLVQYAIAHCKAKFGQTATIPSTVTSKVVRHLGTPECLDKRVEVKYSSCLKECSH